VNNPLIFSIIIANYNYARFLRRALDSAFGLDWPFVEVIVVDDGSTDHSKEIISEYGSRLTAIFQCNSGQRIANNAGFAASSGDVVIFLDADDILEPELAREIAAVWHNGISKVQVQVQRVDVDERPIGPIMPRFRSPPSSDTIRYWATQMVEYPTPPGSGNAYARAFLERIFPLDATRDSATDSTCIAMAPFLGDVVTIAQPLVCYRMHGDNDSNLLCNDAYFGREVGRALKRLRAAQDACEMQGLPLPQSSALRLGSHLLQLRTASLRLLPANHPMSGDNRWRALVDAIAVPFRAGVEPLDRRLMVSGYSILTLLLPIGFARTLIRKRFAQT
jgi:glycosyltransferase involved in cell wall biosynthesis